MKLIVDIDEDRYKDVIESRKHHLLDSYAQAVANGVPISDNATNERMIGSWIKSRDSYGNNHFTCPFCEHDIATKADTLGDNYCSNCGARLQESEKE